MTRTALLVFSFLLPGIAAAVICKTVDPDGVVSYADVPVSECPNAIRLPPSSTYAPRPIEQRAPDVSNATGSVVRFERYLSMKIVQPAADGTVRSSEGKVPVSIALEPELQQGHLVNLYLDGNAVAGSFDGLAIEISGVERGTHSLRAAVVDVSGRRLIESPAVRFTLRKLGLNDPGNKPTPPPDKPAPGYPAPTTPPDYALPKPDYSPSAGPDYRPSGTPDYTPKGGGISTTPGSTNPAFAPRYTP